MKPLLILSTLALAGCAVTVPLGEGAKYGEVELTAVYRAPAITQFGSGVLNQPTLRDK